jgi:hypothetical protein
MVHDFATGARAVRRRAAAVSTWPPSAAVRHMTQDYGTAFRVHRMYGEADGDSMASGNPYRHAS